MPTVKGGPSAAEAAQFLAIEALGFLAAEPERLGRFLALCGLGPDRIRAAAQDPGFLVGVLEHIAGDESLLLVFAEHARVKPGSVTKALAVLSSGRRECEVP